MLSACSAKDAGDAGAVGGAESAVSSGVAVAAKGDMVKVDYTGKFEDGTVFDSSEGRGPLGFTVGAGQMIIGFDEAVEGMRVGESKTVTLPPEKAYGARGSGDVIPPNATLVFDITLVEIAGK